MNSRCVLECEDTPISHCVACNNWIRPFILSVSTSAMAKLRLSKQEKSQHIYVNTNIHDEYKDQIVTILHSVMWVCLCIPGHIHSSCSTVTALLCMQYPTFFPLLFLQSHFNSFIYLSPLFFNLLPANSMLINYMYMISSSTFIFLS